MQESINLNVSTAENLGIGLFKYALLPEQGFISINSALAVILDYSSNDELKGERLDSLFLSSEEKEQFLRILRQEGRVKSLEAAFKNKIGSARWVAISACRVITRNNEEYLEGMVEDISQRKQEQKQLCLERDFLRGFFDSIPDMIYFKDLQNRFIMVNKAHADALNLPPEEIIGKSDLDFFSTQIARKYYDDDNYVIETGKPIMGKIEKAARPDGSITYVSTTKVPHYGRDGRIIGTMGITRNVTVYANLEKERLEMVMNALVVLGKTLEMRDPYTFTHTRNVANIAEKIGEALGWDSKHLLGIRLAGQLHDLGKISIPLDILNKPGKLSDLEYLLIRQHVEKSYELIKDIEFPFSLAETIYQHHERLDGSGYPRMLKQDEVILEARVLSVSDVLEAMVSHRPYRAAMGMNKACEELTDGSGSRYDSKIVKVALNLIKENNGNAFWKSN